MKNMACLVLPGAGTRLGAVAGAVEVLSEHVFFEAFAGTSGGGLVALALASGMTPKEVSALCTSVLVRTDLLDTGIPLIDNGPCLFRGRKIDAILQGVFGAKLMGNLKFPARVGVASLWTKRVCLVDTVWHADVPVWRAARATMSIEGVFDPIRLREDNARTYADGGAGLNVPAGAWDDRTARTIVVRFKEQQPVHNLTDLLTAANGGSDSATVEAVRSGPDLIAASFEVMMGAASAAFPSTKKDTLEVVIESTGDGLKFGLSKDECERRRQHGITSAQRQLTTAGGPLRIA